MSTSFAKYHGLGNDYLVIDAADCAFELTPGRIRRICHRHFGVGSDGILWKCAPNDPLVTHPGQFAVRIYNPDGSEAEKSGNGLRIFARYLFDKAKVTTEPFAVHTLGGTVQCVVKDGGQCVTVQMGQVSFSSTDIPVAGEPREVIDEDLALPSEAVRFSAATIGNPHCVIVRPEISVAETQRLGPLLEEHAVFPHRTNVQFMQILDRANIRIEIWERGAGYTLASGSSASACAAVAVRLGLCDRNVTVHMPGGNLSIAMNHAYEVTMSGAVAAVATGTLAAELTDRIA